jgi:hypothetical protein
MGEGAERLEKPQLGHVEKKWSAKAAGLNGPRRLTY